MQLYTEHDYTSIEQTLVYLSHKILNLSTATY